MGAQGENHIAMQAGQWGFIEYRPLTEETKYRPNIDHTALYRPNSDRKISLKSAYFHYFLQVLRYTFGKMGPFVKYEG